MTGSRLGRGRGGRLAVYGGCAVVLVLLVFLYRAATSEMSRLRELHVQCAHQQEALAAQLQVIFEYKVRLEKSLAEEKSSNAVLKQELQQQATREKSLRDRNSIEAMQRFNSLQQSCKILETEHKDLQEECKKREKQALQDTRELHSRIEQAREDKDKALEKLKRKFFELGTQKEDLEKRYNRILLNNTSTDGSIDHLKKEVFQLKRELAETKKMLRKFTSSDPTSVNSPLHQSLNNGEPGNLGQPNVSSHQQQSSVATSSMKSVPAVRLETSTPASSNPAPTAVDRWHPVPKSGPKAKLPVGVPPIPVMIDPKLESRDQRQDEIARRKEEPRPRNGLDSKEQETDNGNLEPPFPIREAADQLPDRRANGWMNMDAGVQEIGEQLNQIRLPENVEAGDEHDEGVDYDKDPQQKNSDLQLVGGEDEGEDEDDQID